MPEQIKGRYFLIKGISRVGGLADVEKAVDMEAGGLTSRSSSFVVRMTSGLQSNSFSERQMLCVPSNTQTSYD
jgi:hypothetical protein